MPAAIEYSPDDKLLLAASEDERRQRLAASGKAWRYYRGEHDKPLKDAKDNVTLNLVKEASARTVAFLFPAMPQLEIAEPTDTDDERWLREAWRANGDVRLLQRAALFGVLDGHVFLRVLPGDAESGGVPRVVALNPANVEVWWQADDQTRVLWYSLHYETGGTSWRQDIVRGDGAWGILQYRRQPRSSWELVRQDVWPYALGPIVDFQHELNPKSYYGDAETSNIELNDRANKIASDVARILRFHASPRTVGTGFEAGKLQATDVGGLWTIPNPDARVFNLEMQTDLASSMGFLELVVRHFMAERRVVILKGDISDFQRVTNLALRALYMDMLAKNEQLRRQYEGGIAGVSQRLLMLDGRPSEPAPKVIWPDPLPSDPKEMVDVLEKERSMGLVSKESAARERGRDWELEQARMDEEGESMIERMLREPPAPDPLDAPGSAQ